MWSCLYSLQLSLFTTPDNETKNATSRLDNKIWSLTTVNDGVQDAFIQKAELQVAFCAGDHIRHCRGVEYTSDGRRNGEQ